MPDRGRSVPVLIATSAWFLLALLTGAVGLLRSVPPPFPALMILTLVAGLLALFWKWSAFQRWGLAVDIRALVLIHASRFVGIYFLVLYSRGELPYAFAVPGGWGDIAVATTALLVCAVSPTRGAVGRGVLLAWNVLGLVDILLVVATAARLGVADPESMRALTTLPLSLLPTFLVPIIIATHVIIFVRLLAVRRTADGVF